MTEDIFIYKNLADLGIKVQENFIELSWIFMGLFLVIVVAFEIFNKQADFNQFIRISLRLILCAALLTNIIPVRNFFYDTGVSLANSIYSEEKINSFKIEVKQFDKEKLQNLTVWQYLKLPAVNISGSLILFLGKFIYGGIAKILEFLRNFSHFICYIFFPLAVVTLLSRATQNIGIAFFKRFLAICLWPAFISSIYLIFDSITNPEFLIDASVTRYFSSFIYLILLAILLCSIPIFASQFVNGMWGMA